jgi:hypothetical protein
VQTMLLIQKLCLIGNLRRHPQPLHPCLHLQS